MIDLTHYWIWESSTSGRYTYRCLICKALEHCDKGDLPVREECDVLSAIVTARQRNVTAFGSDNVEPGSANSDHWERANKP